VPLDETSRQKDCFSPLVSGHTSTAALFVSPGDISHDANGLACAKQVPAISANMSVFVRRRMMFNE
jgi:hypothetical protein